MLQGRFYKVILGISHQTIPSLGGQQLYTIPFQRFYNEDFMLHPVFCQVIFRLFPAFNPRQIKEELSALFSGKLISQNNFIIVEIETKI